jgi:hypothetical protein
VFLADIQTNYLSVRDFLCPTCRRCSGSLPAANHIPPFLQLSNHRPCSLQTFKQIIYQSETFFARPAGDAQATCQQPVISRLSCNHPIIGRVPCRHSNKLFTAISQRLSLPDLPDMLRQPATSQSYPAFLATSVADPDPGSGAFLTPGSGIRNRFFPDPGSRIPDPKSIYLRAY